ncbi:TPA: hypothetical protein HA251_01160 [Candidatus Woesearchaeota archaeon]|nr:hypothetical protein [Candidatus Woesearchaeota archaeon]
MARHNIWLNTTLSLIMMGLTYLFLPQDVMLMLWNAAITFVGATTSIGPGTTEGFVQSSSGILATLISVIIVFAIYYAIAFIILLLLRPLRKGQQDSKATENKKS